MKKRVNFKFLIILTAVVIGFAALLVASKLLLRRSPINFAAAGDKAAAAGKWNEAVGDYGRALSLGRGDADLFDRFGEALLHRVAEDPKSLIQARAAFENALVVDPQNLTARRQLLEMDIETTEIAPTADALSKLHDNAAKLAELDPTNVRAAAYAQVALVRQGEVTADLSPEQLQDSLTALNSLIHQDPDDADLPYYYAGGMLRLMQRAAAEHDSDRASELARQVAALFDSALLARSDDATLAWRAGSIYAQLAAYDPTNAAAYRAKSENALSRAHEKVKPSDARYADIEVDVARSDAANHRIDEAEGVLRNVLAEFPGNPQAELQLGSILGAIPDQRDAAIDVLSKPISAKGESGLGAVRLREFDSDRMFRLDMIRLEKYATLQDPQQRKDLMDQINAIFKSLSDAVNAESYALLQLKASIQEANGQPLDAMGTYDQALAVMKHGSVKDYELMYRAALLDLREGQSGNAELLLESITDSNPRDVRAHLALAAMFLSEHDTDKAAAALDAAERLAPTNPELLRLRVQQLVAQQSPEQARVYYAKMPETDAPAYLSKARAALQLQDPAEARRLLEWLSAKTPDDAMVAVLLAEVYLRSGDKDHARATAEAALARHPDDAGLQLLLKQTQSTAPLDAREMGEEILASEDPFTRAITRGEIALGKRNFDEAAAQLAAANALKPDNARVHELLFELDLDQLQFAAAEKEVAVLARLQADGADGLIFRVRLEMARGNHAGAIQSAHDLVTRRPEFAESYALLGEALAADGQLEQAVNEFNDALGRQHTNYEALRGLVDAYQQLGEFDSASQTLATARRLFPSSTSFRDMSLDFDLLHSPTPQQVVAERASLLDASPNDLSAYLALARSALHVAETTLQSDPASSRQYLQQATDTLNKAFARWPTDINVVTLLAHIQQYQGNEKQGERLLLDLAASPQWSGKPEPSESLFDFYMRGGEQQAAVRAMQDAFEKSGKTIPLEVRLAALQTQLGQFDQALATLSASADDSAVIDQQIDTLIAAGRIDDAISQAKSAVAAHPGSIDLLDRLVAAQLAAGHFVEARSTARDAVAASPKDNDALYHQALVELNLSDGDMELALHAATQLKDQNPHGAKAYGLLADVYYHRNELDDALHWLEEGVKAAPLDRDARLRLLNGYAGKTPPDWNGYDAVVADAEGNPQLSADPIWMEKAAFGLAARKQFDAAVTQIDAAIAKWPENLDLASDKLSILLNAADYPKVIQSADNLIADNKKQWWIYLARGTAEAPTDKAAALADMDSALAVAPNFAASVQVVQAVAQAVGIDAALQRARLHDDAQWRLLVVDLLISKKDFAAAIKEGESMRNPASGLSAVQRQRLLGQLAIAYSKSDQPQAARDAYMTLLQGDPNNPLVLNNLAYLLAEDLHQPIDAVDYSQKAYDLSRSRTGRAPASIGDTHGWVLTLCGGRDAQLGISILEQVVENDQNFLDARYHLGEAYLRSSMPNDAIKQLQIAQDQIERIEQNHGAVNPKLKAAIADSLARARQLADGKADAAGSK
jgi:Flp pilus assembly protein TadD